MTLRKSKILGPNGGILNPDTPVGFYQAGACPTCGNPAYYHGGGGGLAPKVYKLCTCADTTPFEVRVPQDYDPLTERESFDRLFAGIHAMSEHIINAHLNLRDLQEQLQEFADERSRYLPETTDTGDSRADHAGEPAASAEASQPEPENTDEDRDLSDI